MAEALVELGGPGLDVVPAGGIGRRQPRLIGLGQIFQRQLGVLQRLAVLDQHRDAPAVGRVLEGVLVVLEVQQVDVAALEGEVLLLQGDDQLQGLGVGLEVEEFNHFPAPLRRSWLRCAGPRRR